MRASSPRNVLPLVRSQPSWQVARACGASAMQMSTSGRKNASRTGDWFNECLNGSIVVFISGEDCKNVTLLSSRLPKALAISEADFYAAGDAHLPSETAQRQTGADLISDVLPFGRLWYGEPNAVSNTIGYAEHYSRSHDACTMRLGIWSRGTSPRAYAFAKELPECQ